MAPSNLQIYIVSSSGVSHSVCSSSCYGSPRTLSRRGPGGLLQHDLICGSLPTPLCSLHASELCTLSLLLMKNQGPFMSLELWLHSGLSSENPANADPGSLT